MKPTARGYAPLTSLFYRRFRGFRRHGFGLVPGLAPSSSEVRRWQRQDRRGSPKSPILAAVARRHDATRFQVPLAWVPGDPMVIAIPKAADVAHVRIIAASSRLSSRLGTWQRSRGFSAPDRGAACAPVVRLSSFRSSAGRVPPPPKPA
jgi:diketogulonate reductase-like aldo/keto reductase